MAGKTPPARGYLVDQATTVGEKIGGTAAQMGGKATDLGWTPTNLVDENRRSSAKGRRSAARAVRDRAGQLTGVETMRELSE